MKTCPYCGKEYPDDAVRCLMDDQPLEGGEPSPLPPPTPLSEAPAPPPCPAVLTDRQMRIIELVLVCGIAFGSSILSSLYEVSGHVFSSPSRSEFSWMIGNLREGLCLGLLWYVLRRRGRTFYDLGLSWTWADAGWSLPLKLAGSAGFYAVFFVFDFTGLSSVDTTTATGHVGYYLFGNHVAFTAILLQFLNPFFEELIVRAYMMTEIRQLTNSMTKAVLLSTVLQTSYHFYQGAPVALAHGATFLIFSIYYAKTNRIAPVILAHLYSDVGFTLFYLFHH
ncbi:MAG TPA: CPBP family intramembrane glutamic endopeptidase [Verrucomicrobiae bacterium]|nr:CPBP family intramembrane glutamic endopeptidase [Verrucomicrobiae bacterium]